MSSAAQPILVQIGLAITLESPLCVGATGSSSGIADKELQRDGWGRPMIPGSQIKGRLRHACEQVSRALGHKVCEAPYRDRMCPDTPHSIGRTATEFFHQRRAGKKNPPQCYICALFGSPTYPSPLLFSDAIDTAGRAEAPTAIVERVSRLRPGIGIDRQRRTVRDELLFITETTPAGITLHGTITGRWWNTEIAEVRRLLGLLVAGARLAKRWGGGSSRGLGWSTVEMDVSVNGTAIDDLLQEVHRL
jgi:CRISPR/Cas system CSM-associated protein Csm3 (group 7 of RAMP superfamily)